MCTYFYITPIDLNLMMDSAAFVLKDKNVTLPVTPPWCGMRQRKCRWEQQPVSEGGEGNVMQ